ncbi:MAG: carboxypeptidase-like regulatory domain-containing protein, partial [Bacteroidota bacterium]
MKNRLLQLIITSLKLSCYILILQVVFMTSLMAFDANAQLKSVKEVYISINFKNADVYEVFKEIESKTDFTFHFFKMDIKKNIRVDIKEESITVADVLYKISDVANLKFRQVNNNIAVSRIAGLSDRAKVVAQAIPVQGKVLDETGQPMAGVNVVIEGTTQGTITDIDGNYRLEATAGDILIFSFIGYQTIEMVIGNETTIDVQMEQDSKTLTEVIVRAYGTVKKGAFTGSSTQINAEALEGRALTNITWRNLRLA